MAARAVTALFDSQEDAARVIDRIEAAGVTRADIGIVSLNAADRPAGSVSVPSADASGVATPEALGGHESSAAEGAGAGATVGTVLGGGAGLLASLGLLAIPGAGPVIAAGWLASDSVPPRLTASLKISSALRKAKAARSPPLISKEKVEPAPRHWAS